MVFVYASLTVVSLIMILGSIVENGFKSTLMLLVIATMITIIVFTAIDGTVIEDTIKSLF